MACRMRDVHQDSSLPSILESYSSHVDAGQVTALQQTSNSASLLFKVVKHKSKGFKARLTHVYNIHFWSISAFIIV